MSTPPEHDVDPADLDEDTHPTCAWLDGEQVDAVIVRGID